MLVVIKADEYRGLDGRMGLSPAADTVRLGGERAGVGDEEEEDREVVSGKSRCVEDNVDLEPASKRG
jgi:hypothetical protein